MGNEPEETPNQVANNDNIYSTSTIMILIHK